MPKEVIIIESVNDDNNKTTEVWGSLTSVCEAHSFFQYHTIKKIAFPFVHKGFKFIKLKYNSKRN
jgi:hypothetical protein